MNRGGTLFLQGIIVALGIGMLALMLWFPHIEGRNIDATPFEIYFKDPFLAYAYLASIAFFVALYQAWKLLGYIGHNKAFLHAGVQAVRIIKYCAVSLVVFIAGAEAYFFIAVRGTDDIAGGVMMGLAMIFVSLVAAAGAAVFERTLQSAVALKNENDLCI